MKTLQLISSTGVFGAEKAMLTLSNELHSYGVKTCVGVIGNQNNSQIEEIRRTLANDVQLKIFNCNSKFNIRTIFEIRRYINQNKIEAIHSHNYKSNFYSLLASFNFKIKRITTCHNWLGYNLKMKFYEYLDRSLLRRFDKVIAVSDILKEKILKSGVPEKKITVINNGVDIEKFRAISYNLQFRKLLGLKENERVIGTIGRLTLEKGHSYLIKAFKQIISEFSNTKLLIVGDGLLRHKLELEVDSLKLNGSVIFTGIRNNIPQICSIIDIFVMPSLMEGMPVALLEAMASAKAIIATKVGAIPKIIYHNYSGIIVEPRDVQGLSNSIKMLLRDTAKAKFIAQNAYQKVKSEFSAVKMAENYIKVYNNLCYSQNNKIATDSLKILQIEIAGKGGICHYTYNLAQKLSKLTKVTLITSTNYELKNKERNFELIGIFNRFRTNPLFILRLIKTFRDKKVDIIQFQLSQYPVFVFLLCYLARIFTNKKIVITAHNVVSHESGIRDRKIYRKLYALADKVIVHAQENKLEMEHSLNIGAEKISVIPHGNYLFFNEIKNNVDLSENKFNILFFGYIRKYKGLIYLIRALKLIKTKVPDVKLLIVGKPVDDFREYQSEIDSSGLQDNVEINFGYIPFEQVKDYFEKANVVALPYLNIYQSGILQLAYGFGRPIVTTDVGGMREVVDDGQSGFIVPPKDINALADKIVTILSDRELQEKMGNYALHLARTKFSWDSIAMKTLELYNSIMN